MFQYDQHPFRSRLQHARPDVGCKLLVCDVDTLAHIDTAGRPPRLGMYSVTDFAWMIFFLFNFALSVNIHTVVFGGGGGGRVFFQRSRTGRFSVVQWEGSPGAPEPGGRGFFSYLCVSVLEFDHHLSTVNGSFEEGVCMCVCGIGRFCRHSVWSVVDV